MKPEIDVRERMHSKIKKYANENNISISEAYNELLDIGISETTKSENKYDRNKTVSVEIPKQVFFTGLKWSRDNNDITVEVVALQDSLENLKQIENIQAYFLEIDNIVKELSFSECMSKHFIEIPVTNDIKYILFRFDEYPVESSSQEIMPCSTPLVSVKNKF